MHTTERPGNGLYRPEFEKDNCGFGLIAQMDGKASHWLVATAISSLACLSHRGAVAPDGKTGDGCGLLIKKPDAFFRAIAGELGYKLNHNYAVGVVFLSQDQALAQTACARLGAELQKENLTVAGWRSVPINPEACGAQALKTLPRIEQVLVNAPDDLAENDFERRLYIARRRAEKALNADDATFYIPSLSCRVISYKGLVMPANLPLFYPDLRDERFASALVVYHQRFSTNTWPEWRLAQPFRYLAHNGEINTLQGNRNWAAARSHTFHSALIPDMDDVRPLVSMTGSDSLSLDNMLDALIAGGM
ncbi:MAG: glutamate synthase large subunit, partial [Gammaproteobacteria bacterium]|nr:glutamate synthase large subunit [Gammaproteobacteria bacterium]